MRSATAAIALAASLAACGCDILGFKSLMARRVEATPGHIYELAKPAKLTVYVTDAKTGERVVCVLEAWPGYLVGREARDGGVPSPDPARTRPQAEVAPELHEEAAPRSGERVTPGLASAGTVRSW